MHKSHIILLGLLLCASEMVFAYGGNYGSGVWGGQQSCGHGSGAGSSVYSKDDEYADYKTQETKAKANQKKAEKKVRSIKKDLKEYKEDLRDYFKKEAADLIYSHIRDQRAGFAAEKTPPYWVSVPVSDGGEDATKFVPSNACSDDADRRGGTPKVFCKGTKDMWVGNIVNNNALGVVNGEFACKATDILQSRTASSSTLQDRCQDMLENMQSLIEELLEEEDKVAMNKADNKHYKRLASRRKDDIDDEIADGTYTEGSWCAICNSKVDNKSYLLGTVLNVAGSLGGAYMGYKGAQNISEQNARLGWPTQPWIASQMAYPYIMQGIYGGLMGGMGQGGFGCSGGYYGIGPNGMMGMGGNFGAGLYGPGAGAFGYPPNMFGNGPWGGGPYMPGMGPWGIPGPMGGGGYGMPGYMVGGVVGGVIGAAYGGYPVAGYPTGMAMGGFPMGGYPAGGGYPGGGYQMGYPVGGVVGGVIGMAGGGYPFGGGYPGGAMGYPMGAAMGSAMGYEMGMGYPMGMAMGGVMGYPMGMAMGGPIGTPPFMPGAALGGAMGLPVGMAAGGALGVGYQQQFMQQYMQQMQAQMQAQQQAQQDYMQKQQVVGRLTEELYRIQMQIQQISSGSYYGGSIGGSVNLFGNPGGSVPFNTTPSSTGNQRILGR